VAWRSLLGEIVSLSDGPLGEALRSWEAPSSLEDSGLELAQLLDRTLDDALMLQLEVDAAELRALAELGELEDLENLSDRIRLQIRDEIRDELRGELRREFANAGEGN